MRKTILGRVLLSAVVVMGLGVSGTVFGKRTVRVAGWEFEYRERESRGSSWGRDTLRTAVHRAKIDAALERSTVPRVREMNPEARREALDKALDRSTSRLLDAEGASNRAGLEREGLAEVMEAVERLDTSHTGRLAAENLLTEMVLFAVETGLGPSRAWSFEAVRDALYELVELGEAAKAPDAIVRTRALKTEQISEMAAHVREARSRAEELLRADEADPLAGAIDVESQVFQRQVERLVVEVIKSEYEKKPDAERQKMTQEEYVDRYRACVGG